MRETKYILVDFFTDAGLAGVLLEAPASLPFYDLVEEHSQMEGGKFITLLKGMGCVELEYEWGCVRT